MCLPRPHVCLRFVRTHACRSRHACACPRAGNEGKRPETVEEIAAAKKKALAAKKQET